MSGKLERVRPLAGIFKEETLRMSLDSSCGRHVHIYPSVIFSLPVVLGGFFMRKSPSWTWKIKTSPRKSYEELSELDKEEIGKMALRAKEVKSSDLGGDEQTSV